MIKHKNIIYMPTISPLGGIETYVYEMVKKYKDLDIAVVSKTCDPIQAKRIRKYCPLYIHNEDMIECDVAIINYDTSIIKYISKNAKIYQTIHGDYTNSIYGGRMPQTNSRITAYIAITKYLQEKMKYVLGSNVIMSYNPLTIEEDKPFLTFVTASRLHQNKGVSRMKLFLQALDRAGIDYIWYCITNDVDVIKHPKVIMIKNRLDVDKWIRQADYVVLLSDSEACSYTINEALYRNIPIIVTPLPYLKEIGVEDGKNAYIIDFDCKNVDDVAKKVLNIPKFTFKQLKDDYRNIFSKSESNYDGGNNMKYKVEAIINFYDMVDKEDKYKELPELNKDGSQVRESQHIWICDKERAAYLLDHNAIRILETINPEPSKIKLNTEEVIEDNIPQFIENTGDITKNKKEFIVDIEKPKKKTTRKKVK